MNSNDALVLIFSRNAFYKRLHYLALAALGMMVLTIGILIWVLIYVAKMQPLPLYFATDNVGRLVHISPVGRPNMTNEEITQWVADAVQAAYSYDYLNYRAQLQNAQKYFTGYGWSKYLKALEASNNLDGVKERRWIGLAKVVESPKILEQGVLSTGEYAWKFQVYILATYLRPPAYDQATMRVDPLILTVLVERQPVLQSFKGLGIAQIVAEFASKPIEQPEQAPVSQ